MVLQAQISPILGIWDPVTCIFTTFDVLQLQSTRPREWRTWPIQRAQFHRFIPFTIWPLVVVLQAQISQFQEFEIPQQLHSPLLICSNYSQPSLWNPGLDLFSALKLIVSSSMWSGQWLQCYKHKYLQFSEFDILWQLHSPPLMCFNYSQPGLWNPILDLCNALNLNVSSSLPSR